MRPHSPPVTVEIRRAISCPQLVSALPRRPRKPRTNRLLSAPGPRVLLSVLASPDSVEGIVSPFPPPVNLLSFEKESRQRKLPCATGTARLPPRRPVTEYGLFRYAFSGSDTAWAGCAAGTARLSPPPNCPAAECCPFGFILTQKSLGTRTASVERLLENRRNAGLRQMLLQARCSDPGSLPDYNEKPRRPDGKAPLVWVF